MRKPLKTTTEIEKTATSEGKLVLAYTLSSAGTTPFMFIRLKRTFLPAIFPYPQVARAILDIGIAIAIDIGLFTIPGAPFSVEIAFCLERIRFSIVLFYRVPDSVPDSDFDSDSDEDIGLLLVLR